MIAIINYNAGNTRSVQNALTRLGYDSIVTDDPRQISSADKVIFPGVGEAGTAMRNLKEKGLDKIIMELKQPVLGICLGMQLMCSHTEESNTNGLGIFDVEVKKFPNYKIIPHMGWNTLRKSSGELFKDIPPTSDVYFVHSYYVKRNNHMIAQTNYIIPFSAALQKDNFYACQFHPEKSAKIGEQILLNFLSL
jgi:glutamine amidotransferase